MTWGWAVRRWAVRRWAVRRWAGRGPPYLDVDAEDRVLFAHVPEADVWLKLVEHGDEVVDQFEVPYLFYGHLAAKRRNIVFLLTDLRSARPSLAKHIKECSLAILKDDKIAKSVKIVDDYVCIDT